MNFVSLVRKNRSYRNFDESRKISREELMEMVDCARLVPSAQNGQPLKYFLSADAETNAVIQPLTAWAGKLRPGRMLPDPGHLPQAFIVINVDLALCPNALAAEKDVGIAAQTLLLKATEMGLGGIMIGAFKPELSKRLGLPETLKPALVIALGKPDEEIILENAKESVDYYRDENDVHHVPKRTLDEIVL